MIKIKQAIIVEGKYDKIKLSSIVDAPIIVTNGFAIFKDKDKLSYIKRVAKSRGIVIMTDSDNAGFMIRNRVLQVVDNKADVINVYIPDIFGKEKRKSRPSAEGKLGVEGIDIEVLKNSLKKYGVTCENSTVEGRILTKTDLFTFGLSGAENSVSRRKQLLKKLSLPENMTANNLLEAVNILLSYNEFVSVCNELFNEE